MISCLILSSGCAKEPYIPKVPPTQYVILVPEKLPLPVKPQLEIYNSKESLTSKSNFIKFQKNTVHIVNYSNELKEQLLHYHEQIDNMMDEKSRMEMEAEEKLVQFNKEL